MLSQLGEHVDCLFEFAGVGQPVRQIIASNERVGMIRTENSLLVAEQLGGHLDSLVELPVSAKTAGEIVPRRKSLGMIGTEDACPKPAR